MRYVPCMVRRGISCLAVRLEPKKKPRRSKQAQSTNDRDGGDKSLEDDADATV